MTTRFLTLLAVLSQAALPVFAAEQHYLVVRVYKDQAAYTQTLRATEYSQKLPAADGRQFTYNGPVRDKEFTFSGLLKPDAANPSGPLDLQLQLQLGGAVGDSGRYIQAQVEVAIAPGDNLTITECGPWTVKIALDTNKNIKKTAWNEEGLPNYRLTTNVDVGGIKQRCRLISKPVQANVTDGVNDSTRKYGFIFTPFFRQDKTGSSFDLQYQLEQGFHNPARPFQLQKEEKLTLGRKVKIAGKGYSVDFLLEGEIPAKRTMSGAVTKPRSKNTYGTVPIIE